MNPRGKVLSREVHSLAYRHDDDGKAYRHEFEGPVRAELKRDGSVLLRSSQGKKIWDDFPERPYLVNPHTKRAQMAKRPKRKAGTRARRGKRPPPKGYGSWKAYMAAIRPGASAPKRARTHKEATMARKGKKRAKSRHRKNPARGRTVVVHTHKKVASRGRRRYRRNPPGVKGLLALGMDVAIDTGVIVGGRAAARVLPQLASIDTATDMGRGAQAVLGLLAAGGLHFAGHSSLGCKLGAAILSVPAEAYLKDLTKDSTNPLVASAFGDDEILISSYVQPEKALGSYVQPGGAQRSEIGSYVQQ